MDLKFALRSLRNNPGSGNISVPDFQDWKHQSTAFSATAYYVNYSTVAMTGPAAEWFRTLLLGIFTGLAVCLAMAGVYGVRAYLVGQRSSEIGLRMALGALPGDMLRMVVLEAARLALAGIAIVSAAALALSRLVQSQLFGVQAADPVILTCAAALLGLVALGAALAPGLRAARIDPLSALKYE